MKTKRYERTEATNLVPLLKSIASEIEERRLSLRRLELRLRAARSEDEAANMEAERAIHKKELRLAQAELERLGCMVDCDHPLRVMIPGPNGEYETGYLWDSLRDDDLQAIFHPADSAA